MPRPRHLLVPILLVVLVGCAASREAPLDCRGCNVIVVTFDSLRADHLGVYGYGKNTSPRIDAFARESYVFSDILSQTGTTVPSFASMWTSLFPYADGAVNTRGGLGIADEPITLAQVLQQHGYRTAAVIGHAYAGSRFGFGRGFDDFDDDHQKLERPEHTLERALESLERLGELEVPFFLWVHFKQPHWPYTPAPDIFKKFYDGPPDEPLINDVGREIVLEYYKSREEATTYILEGKKRWLTASMLEQYRALYDANIYSVDSEFGKLIDHIDATILGSRTVLFVTSDHGESMGEHHLFDHNSLYYGILHTPLIVRLPGRHHGLRDSQGMIVDIFPTILKLLGIDYEAELRGRNLFEEDGGHVFQFAEYENDKTLKVGKHRINVSRRGHGTLVRPYDTVRLFDVVADPDEANDLSDAAPEITRELQMLLAGLPPPTANSDTMDRLRTLGYIE